jgi:hypothetical protein
MAGIVTTKIITGGLGVGFKACEGLITTYFSLYCVPVAPPVPPTGGGGGPYPGPAWNKVDNIQNFYQPVKDIYDPDAMYKTKKQVIIKVDFGTFHMEKIYLVPIQRADTLVAVLNVLNVTRARINIGVSKLRRVLHNIKISIYGLKRKK